MIYQRQCVFRNDYFGKRIAGIISGLFLNFITVTLYFQQSHPILIRNKVHV